MSKAAVLSQRGTSCGELCFCEIQVLRSNSPLPSHPYFSPCLPLIGMNVRFSSREGATVVWDRCVLSPRRRCCHPDPGGSVQERRGRAFFEGERTLRIPIMHCARSRDSGLPHTLCSQKDPQNHSSRSLRTL